MTDPRPVFQNVWQEVLAQWNPTTPREGSKEDWLRFYLLHSPVVSQVEEPFLLGDVGVPEVLNALALADAAVS